MDFHGHNVVLPGGVQTAPNLPVLAEAGVCQAALRMLRLCLPDGGTVADLGCLEGGYAAEFARAGYDVTGIEARGRNFSHCQYLAAQLELPNLRFAQDDARNLEAHGEFDAVFCAGLLYHLDAPDAFLKMLGTVTRKLLILQTHFSQAPREENEGRHGHWYGDHPGDDDVFGSHGNHLSFWMAERDLLQAIRDAGFGTVLTVHDYLPDILAGPQGRPSPPNPDGGEDRGMYAGVKAR